MPDLLRVYEKDGYEITEYTKDGKTVSHTVSVPISKDVLEPPKHQPTNEEKMLAEMQYQTMLLEMSTLGGN